MRNLKTMLLLLPLAGVAALALTSCKKDNEPPPVFPVKKVITNWEGKELDVVIVGRNRSEIVFTKPGDTTRIHYPIGKLSEEDKEFVAKLPREQHYKETPWIKSKRDELRRIEVRIAEHTEQIAKTPRAETRNRALKREIKKLQEEKKELEKEILADQRAGR